MEVSVGGHQTVMVLGSRFSQGGHTLEQWFSGEGEMLELRDGRVHRALGMTSEIRRTQAAPPAWQALSEAPKAIAWQRERDVMPGYQQRQEKITTRKARAPRSNAFGGASWVEEEVSTQRLNGQAWRYTERFAVQGQQVLYSEQCVSPSLCLKLKPLGVVKP